MAHQGVQENVENCWTQCGAGLREELIKVRGFQVAPVGLRSLRLVWLMLLFPTWLGAELEGHLLNHKSVADVCLVPLQYDYSGEVPIAFTVARKRSYSMVTKKPS